MWEGADSRLLVVDDDAGGPGDHFACSRKKHQIQSCMELGNGSHRDWRAVSASRALAGPRLCMLGAQVAQKAKRGALTPESPIPDFGSSGSGHKKRYRSLLTSHRLRGHRVIGMELAFR
jgi:hypothetical protein